MACDCREEMGRRRLDRSGLMESIPESAAYLRCSKCFKTYIDLELIDENKKYPVIAVGSQPRVGNR